MPQHPSISSFFNDKSIKGLAVWKTLQLFFLVLFIALIYIQEETTIALLAGKVGYLPEVQQILISLNPIFLPFRIWLLIWPFFVVSIALILFKKWRWYFMGLAGILTSALLVGDKLYFHFFKSLLTLGTFKIANLLWDVKSSVFNALSAGDILWMLSFLIFPIWGIIVNRYTNSGLTENKRAFSIDKAFGVIFFLLAVNSFHTAFYLETRDVEWFRDKNNKRIVAVHDIRKSKSPPTSKPGTQQQFTPSYKSSVPDWAVNFGLLNLHLKNIFTVLSFSANKRILTPGEFTRIVKWLDHKKELNTHKSPFYGIAKGRNVFLIALESFHPLLMDLVIDETPVTPTLNRLKQDALIWNHIIDQNHAGGSSDSEFAVMTGLLPSRKYVAAIELPGKISLLGLPKALSTHGYQTLSFHGNTASFWNRNINHPIFGVQKMYFIDSFKPNTMLGMGIPDKEFFLQSLDILSRHKMPFFAYLISLSNHHPYKAVPKGYQDLFIDSVPPRSEAAGYFQLVRYTDDALGGFLAKAKRMGYWQNSIFVIYGDHIPPINEKTKAFIGDKTGTRMANFTQSRIPLLILIPGEENMIHKLRETYSSVVGDQHDIFPTIFHLLGIDVPFGISGTHLFLPNAERDPIIVTSKVFVSDGLLYYGPRALLLSPNYRSIAEINKTEFLKKQDQIRVKYLQALADMSNHQLLFESDAQIKARNFRNGKFGDSISKNAAAPVNFNGNS